MDSLKINMHTSFLIITPLLIIATGFFVATEFAIVRVRSTQLEALLHVEPRAAMALEIHNNLKLHLSSIQVAVTLLTISLGAMGEDLFVSRFQDWLLFVPWPRAAMLIGTGLGLISMTLLQVVLAELLPRSIAIRSTVPIALATAGPLLVWSRIIAPITWLLVSLTYLIESLGGFAVKRHGSGEESVLSEEEIKRILAKSYSSSEQEPRRSDLIENIFDFFKRTTKEIAIPRAQVVYLDLRRSLEENLTLARSCPHTRLPVVDGDLDHVVGIVHLKELLWALNDKGGDINLRDLTQPTFSVPEMRFVHDLLLDFQQQKQHLAMVVNEHGGIDGLVTLEDVLEELVGEIQDEFDREVKDLRHARGGIWIAQGTVTLEQLADILGIHLKATMDSVTLGGFFQERLGRVLKVGDELCIPGWRVRVIKMRGMAPREFLFKPSSHLDSKRQSIVEIYNEHRS
jgi:CBS domain containing-hemolysin-like protein